MASHVSTCMSMEKSIKGEGNQFIEEESNKKESKEKKKRKRRKGERKRRKRKSAFRRSELVRPRSRVHIFNEGYSLRGRDCSYFGLLSTIRVVGLCLCPKLLFGRILKYGNAAPF